MSARQPELDPLGSSGVRPGRARLGFTREVQILLSAGLLLLIVLSTFTLFSYRNAVELLTEERRAQAVRMARRLAERISSGGPISPEILPRLAPEAVAVVLTDSRGVTLTATGLVVSDPLAPLGGSQPREVLAMGPDRELPETVAGFAPLAVAGERRYLRIDLPAPNLAAQHRSLPLLTAVVLGINGALAVLLIAFLRHLLAPYRTLLARARQLSGPAEAGADETVLLLSTFERAVEALEKNVAATTQRAPASQDPELAALERTLSASLDSGLLLLDRSGAVLGVNPAGAEVLDIPSPASELPMEQVLAGRPELLEVLRHSVETRRGVRRREIVVGSTGATLGLSVHPLRRDDGVVRGYLVLFTDLTEMQREAEESRLAESLARLGEMAAGVAHELRNSLATLRGYLGLLERSFGSAEQSHDLSEMRRETDHLQRVVDDFLAFARPETARVEEMSLGTVVERAVADPALGGIRVEIEGREAGDAEIRGDPQLLERAVRNLLRNAMEAQSRSRTAANPGPQPNEATGHETPVVRVVMVRHDEEVEVRVEDEGPGVPREIRHRLFQPFASGRPEGVGLGLALSHRIVSLHGGRLRVEDREGGGTRVRLQLPIATPDT